MLRSGVTDKKGHLGILGISSKMLATQILRNITSGSLRAVLSHFRRVLA